MKQYFLSFEYESHGNIRNWAGIVSLNCDIRRKSVYEICKITLDDHFQQYVEFINPKVLAFNNIYLD